MSTTYKSGSIINDFYVRRINNLNIYKIVQLSIIPRFSKIIRFGIY